MIGERITPKIIIKARPHGVLNKPETILPPGAANATSGMNNNAKTTRTTPIQIADLFIRPRLRTLGEVSILRMTRHPPWQKSSKLKANQDATGLVTAPL